MRKENVESDSFGFLNSRLLLPWGWGAHVPGRGGQSHPQGRAGFVPSTFSHPKVRQLLPVHGLGWFCCHWRRSHIPGARPCSRMGDRDPRTCSGQEGCPQGTPLRGSWLCPYPSQRFADPVLSAQTTGQFPNPGVEMRFIQPKIRCNIY